MSGLVDFKTVSFADIFGAVIELNLRFRGGLAKARHI